VPADPANHSRGPQSHTFTWLGLGYHLCIGVAAALEMRICLMSSLFFSDILVERSRTLGIQQSTSMTSRHIFTTNT
jgi:hypothetical protein